ncbi:MAG: hypothetical protein WCO13_14675 [Bacteroidota bacterium]
MDDNNNILGCFVSSTIGDDNGVLFRTYIYSDNGIYDTLKRLKHKNYGKDLILILFQFYVNPIAYELQNLKEIENYRKKERAIGIPVIINNKNFFSKSEEDRYSFLKQFILQKLDVLAEVIKKKKLDTNIELLKSDLKNILD